MIKKFLINYSKLPVLYLLFFAGTVSGFAQKTITGTVKDNTGVLLPGAVIMVVGGNSGTQTDFDGNYTIDVDNENVILEFSLVGFKSLKEPVAGRTVIDVTLESDITSLDEVVVVAYGKVKKSDVTGAVNSVKAEDLNSGAVFTPQQLLQGKSPGVSISQNSGRPGSNSQVRIRGANSIRFGNNPLYVIDGVPVSFSESSFASSGNRDRSSRESTNPLSLINPADIAQIDVLKDASAKALYGSRAANGVIIITTKRGKAGKSKLSYNSYVGVSAISKKLPILNADQFRQFNTDNPNEDFVDGGENVDWQDEIFRNAITQSHTLSMTGGSDGTNYLASLGYQDQEGIIISSGVQNITGRLNLNTKFIEDKLDVSASIAYSQENSDNIPSVSGVGGDAGGDVIRDALRANPTIPVKADNGNFSFIDKFVQNPVEQARLIQDVGESKRVLANIAATLKLAKGLSFKTNIGFTQENIEKKSFFPLSSRLGSESGGFANFQTRDNDTKLIETTLNYTTSFGSDHKLAILGGYSWQEFNNSGSLIQTSGFIEDNLGFNAIQSGFDRESLKAQTGASVRRLASFFGRVNYDLMNKYLFTATVRRDGSTVFGENNKWGLFPSVAIGWKISNEDFLAESNYVSFLKLRTSYGITGNGSIPNFGSLNTLELVSSTVPELGGFARPKTFANENLKWESTTEANVGIDYGFFNNFLKGSIDFYQKTTDDLIIEFSVPQPSAVKTRLENVAEIQNTGLEFSANVSAIAKDNFSLNFNGNIAYNKNEILSLSKGSSITPEFGIANFTAPSPQQGSPIRVHREGESLNSLIGYDFIGFDENGEERFRDINNDGQITVDEDRIIIGKADPDFTYGFGFDGSYKRFSFSAFFRGVQGIEIYNSLRNDLENITTLPIRNSLQAVLTGPATGAPGGQVSSRFVEDASFIRLENVKLGYDVDVSKVKYISGLNLYITGQNLFTFTEFTGYDPEVNIVNYTNYPRSRTFTFGLNAQF